MKLVTLLAFVSIPLSAALTSPSWYTPPPASIFKPSPVSSVSGISSFTTAQPASIDYSFGSDSQPSGEEEEEHDEHWHKDLLPLDWTDYAGFICAAVGLVIASGGGIGGGGMLVPIYILVMKFSPKYAIPLSNVTVFGGAVMNYIMNLSKRHPSADRPLVDWDLILVMQPMTIAGALLGSLVNKMLPELILTISLVILLVYTTYDMLKKGITTFNKETEQFNAAKKARQESELTRIVAEVDKDVENESLLQDDERTMPMHPDLMDIIEKERGVPLWKVGSLWAIFVVIIIVNLLKGGGGFDSPLHITCGSPGYWFSTAFMFFWILLVSHYLRQYLLNLTLRKQQLSYKYVEGDIAWDNQATIVYPLICILAGMCAGMFGIGGGIVQVPVMLKMGINPKVAAASSAVMIMYTSFTAMTSFYVFGLLRMDYAWICLLLGLGVTFIGQVGLTMLIKKLGRDSLIIFSVAAVVGLSAILMSTHSMIQLADSTAEDAMKIGQICASG